MAVHKAVHYASAIAKSVRFNRLFTWLRMVFADRPGKAIGRSRGNAHIRVRMMQFAMHLKALRSPLSCSMHTCHAVH